MPRYAVETSAVITQTVEINADSIETAQEWAMDLLKRQLEDYQKAAIFESNIHHNTFEIYEYETMQAYGVE